MIEERRHQAERFDEAADLEQDDADEIKKFTEQLEKE